MANLNVSGGVNINLLKNGDNLNTVLIATSPLYQTFKKGTSDFSPNWEKNPVSRPTIYPRIYSVMEAKTIVPVNCAWKYNGAQMAFDGNGLCTSPEIPAGKIRKTTFNGVEALVIEKNLASSTNNDSDVISFSADATASAQTLKVSAEIQLLIEEATSGLYRLFLSTADDVIDGNQTSISLEAMLFNQGVKVTTGVQYEFLNEVGTVLQAKSTNPIITLTKAQIDAEMLVYCKAYMDGVVVSQERKQVWDSTDPYTIICDKGTNINQLSSEDINLSFSVMNARTSLIVSGVTFAIKVIKNATLADITGEFAKTGTSVTIPGAKMLQHQSIYVDVSCTITA